MLTIQTALLSVYDKTGIAEFAKFLSLNNVSIISTGGTAKVLSRHGIEYQTVEQITGYPELLDGRVKTLHPLIYAALLAKKDTNHFELLKKYNIKPLDMVVVNLYPFEKVVAGRHTLEDAIENIDIGGVTLIRAAAKNYERVCVVTNPAYYEMIENQLEKNRCIDMMTLRKLAIEAFSYTASYDAIIYNYLHNKFCSQSFPQKYIALYEKICDLKYGENPHQKAAFYKQSPQQFNSPSVVNAVVLHGKELSYNNILDNDAALAVLQEFKEPTAVIIKHGTPCGVASHSDIVTAYLRAYECDPVSAFGSVVAVNRTVDEEFTKSLKGKFVESLIAPAYTEEALTALKNRKKLRVVKVNNFEFQTGYNIELRDVKGGILLQETDVKSLDMKDLKPVTNRTPTLTELNDLIFGWKIVRHVKSNAIVFVKDYATIGVGGGQLSRVNAVRVATQIAKERAQNAVMCSDAFFPFRDGIDVAGKAGISAVIQPGGSIRDAEVIAAANEYNMAMVFTGWRVFKH